MLISPTDIPEMAHVPHYSFVMPPLTDAMLAGFHIPEGADEDDESGTEIVEESEDEEAQE